MDLHLTNKLALITGSTKGIGKAIAIEMAREGTDVIINGRNEAEVTKVVKKYKQCFQTLILKQGLPIFPLKVNELLCLKNSLKSTF